MLQVIGYLTFEVALLLKFVVRIAFAAVGAALIVDAALPLRVEPLQVDRHTSETRTDHGAATGEITYKVHLVGGVPSSCSVGYAAYSALKDGDAVEVQSTKLFRSCVRISRGEQVVDFLEYWRWLAVAGGMLLLAAALGWMRDGDDLGD